MSTSGATAMGTFEESCPSTCPIGIRRGSARARWHRVAAARRSAPRSGASSSITSTTGRDPLLDESRVLAWFLDPAIEFPNPTAATNLEPLLINTAGSWSDRPEVTTRIANLMLAADYVRTTTDLATMEGANEAARRAVNAILDATGSTASRCALFDLARAEDPAPRAPARPIALAVVPSTRPHAPLRVEHDGALTAPRCARTDCHRAGFAWSRQSNAAASSVTGAISRRGRCSGEPERRGGRTGVGEHVPGLPRGPGRCAFARRARHRLPARPANCHAAGARERRPRGREASASDALPPPDGHGGGGQSRGAVPPCAARRLADRRRQRAVGAVGPDARQRHRARSSSGSRPCSTSSTGWPAADRRSWPLWVRWSMSKVHHVGGIHAGCALAGTAWLGAFTGVAIVTRVRHPGASRSRRSGCASASSC